MTTSRVPERLCLVCRQLKPRTELFRLVKPKEEPHYLPNPDGKIAGKGIYFCRDQACLTRLQKEKRYKRLFLDKLQQGGLSWMLQQVSGTDVDLGELQSDQRRKSASL